MKKKLLCFLLAGILVVGNGIGTLATSVSEVKQQQTETRDKLEEVNQSIVNIENKRKEVSAELSNLNQDLVDTMLTLELLEADLEKKKEEIDEAQKEYDEWKRLEEEQYRSMKLRIQFMYENAETNYLTLLLQSKSISEFLNKADFAKEVYQYDDVKLEEYERTKVLVAEKKAILEEEQAELEEVQEAQNIYKEQLDGQIAAAKSEMAGFETELANAKQKAKEYRTTIQQQNALIQQYEEEERRRQEAEAQQTAPSTPQETTPPRQETTPVPQKDPAPTVNGSGRGAQIAAYAVQFVGNPYVPGGTSLTNGADCSGFTWAVHKHFGITIPRVSVDQANGGKSVSIANVQPGDIIYYGHHVGIYIGNGKIVHASTQKTGIKISNYTYRTPICVRRYW